MKFSSGLKVGLLTIIAILILVFTVLWVKGRSISSGERITVAFKDINGLRAGSGVQMMGVRIGQVESLTPKISQDNSYVEVKFVITEPNIRIPEASTLSIQQSGIIGELFLEVTPPKLVSLYVPFDGSRKKLLNVGDKVETFIEDDYKDVGVVKSVEIVETRTLDPEIANEIGTKYAYKAGYTIIKPGVIMPDLLKGKAVVSKGETKLRLASVNGLQPKLPKTACKYTIIEPMRISDFMALQYRSATALAVTNEKLSYILSDDVMNDIKKTVKSLESLTNNANTTIDKANALLDTSKSELMTLSANANELTSKLNKIADTVVKITDDEKFAENVTTTVENVGKLSGQMNTLLKDPDTQQMIKDLSITAKNVSEISAYVNDMTKDEKLKKSIQETVTNLNTAICKLTITLDTVNYATEDQREEIKQSVKDVEATAANLKKFSTRLNKRFLLWRLIF